VREQFSFKNIYKLAWPAIASHATVMFVGIIDLAFIARLPSATVAIAAASIANNVCGAIYSFLEGIRSGTTILVAQFYGANDKKNISRTLMLALYYASIIGVLVLVVTPLISKFIYHLIGNKIAHLGNPYLIIRLIGLPFHLIIFAIIGLFRGLKNTFIPMCITITICLFNLIFNYIFMYGSYGLPKLGMNGVALGSASAYFISFLISILLVLTLPISKKYVNFQNSFKPLKKTFVKVGTEIGAYSGIVIIALFAFVFLYIPQGAQVIAAHQIAFQSFMVTYLFPMGFFVATSIIISKLFGEKEYHFIIPATVKIWVASLPVVGVIALLTAIFAPNIAHFFSPGDSYVANLATGAIYQICIIQLLCTFFAVLKGALTALKDTRFVLIAGTITSYLFFIPLTYILGIKLGYGIWGGYLAFILWTALDNVIFGFRFAHIMTNRLFFDRLSA
jgi:putative MATE family efflux protein